MPVDLLASASVRRRHSSRADQYLQRAVEDAPLAAAHRPSARVPRCPRSLTTRPIRNRRFRDGGPFSRVTKDLHRRTDHGTEVLRHSALPRRLWGHVAERQHAKCNIHNGIRKRAGIMLPKRNMAWATRKSCAASYLGNVAVAGAEPMLRNVNIAHRGTKPRAGLVSGPEGRPACVRGVGRFCGRRVIPSPTVDTGPNALRLNPEPGSWLIPRERPWSREDRGV